MKATEQVLAQENIAPAIAVVGSFEEQLCFLGNKLYFDSLCYTASISKGIQGYRILEIVLRKNLAKATTEQVQKALAAGRIL